MTVRLILLLTTVLLHSGISQEVKQKPAQRRQEPAEFNFAALRSSYTLGEPIAIRYSVINTSHKPLYIRRQMGLADSAQSGVKVNIYDIRDDRFRPSGAADSFSFYKKTADLAQIAREEWLLMSPNEFLGQQTVLLEAPRKPGRYKLVAEYFNYTSRFFNDSQREQLKKLPHPLLEGTLTAAPVWIEILPSHEK